MGRNRSFPLVLILCIAGCAGSKTAEPPPTTTATTIAVSSGVAFLRGWCPQVESAAQTELAAAAQGESPTEADVTLADRLFSAGPLASLKATIDSAAPTKRPITAAGQISAAADYCHSRGYGDASTVTSTTQPLEASLRAWCGEVNEAFRANSQPGTDPLAGAQTRVADVRRLLAHAPPAVAALNLQLQGTTLVDQDTSAVALLLATNQFCLGRGYG